MDFSTRQYHHTNIIHELGKDIILTDEGYITFEAKKPIYHYYLKDHLSGNRVVIDQTGKIEQANHYYPYGGLMGESTNGGVQAYKYNGKELQRDNGLDQYYYGARMYDAAVGRWTTMDPLCEKYYNVSPYAYCAGNPMNNIDIEGKKILFVNGHWSPILGVLGFGPSHPREEYWDTNFFTNAKKFFDDYSPYDHRNYIDGSSHFGFDQSGADRYKNGVIYAKTYYNDLIANMRENEKINMVTHSEGAAFGAGIISYLLSRGVNVGTVVHLSADEGDEFSTSQSPFTIQFSYDRDWVTGNHFIKGTDIQIIDTELNGYLLNFLYVHGQTNSSDVFKKIIKALDKIHLKDGSTIKIDLKK